METTKETKTATVFTDSDGIHHPFMYNDLESLTETIYYFIIDNDYLSDEDIRVTLADGTSFWWNFFLARACFCKGRITAAEMIEELLNTEEVII